MAEVTLASGQADMKTALLAQAAEVQAPRWFSEEGSKYRNCFFDAYLQPDSSSRPTVVLFGWHRANPRHVRKVGKWYRDELQYNVVMIRVPPSYVMIWVNSNRPLLRDLAQFLVHRHLDTQPLMLACYSGGGSVPMAMWLHMISTDPAYQHLCALICGVMQDSVPYLMRFPTPTTLIGRIWRAICTPFLIAWYRWGPGSGYMHFEKYMHIPFNGTPSLIAYSEDDHLVSADGVRKTIAELRSNGGDVIEVYFEKSRHVSHFLDHPDEYKPAVAEFWAKCLAEHQA